MSSDIVLKFTALNALRGLAALAVAVYHFRDTWAGYLAVDFFLVLSGFILSHSYLYSDKKYTHLEFITHRIARLYPLHIYTLFVFIAVSYFLYAALPEYPDGRYFTFIQNLTLLHNVGLNYRDVTYNAPSWSISVEFWLNIGFIYYVTRKTKTFVLLSISLFSLVLIAVTIGTLDTHFQNIFTYVNSGLLRGLSSFLLGIIAYRIFTKLQADYTIVKYTTLLQTLSIITVVLVIICRDTKYSSLDFIAPFVFMFMVVSFAFENTYFTKYLKDLHFFGEISYSIYLNQYAVLLLVSYYFDKYSVSQYIQLDIYMLVLLAYSLVTYKYIERPSRQKLRSFLPRLIQGK